jgi:hypothetical protein
VPILAQLRRFKMIKLTMNIWDFKKVMREIDTYANNFTDEGLELLFEYLEDLGGDIEMDTIAICSDWTEYKNIPSLVSTLNT